MGSDSAISAVCGHWGGGSETFCFGCREGCVATGVGAPDAAFVSGFVSGLVPGLLADLRRLFLAGASCSFLASVLGPAFASGMASGFEPAVVPSLGPDHVLAADPLFLAGNKAEILA